jgi:hypothetical protein
MFLRKGAISMFIGTPLSIEGRYNRVVCSSEFATGIGSIVIGEARLYLISSHQM